MPATNRETNQCLFTVQNFALKSTLQVGFTNPAGAYVLRASPFASFGNSSVGLKPMDIYTTIYMVFLFFALWGVFGAICYFGIKASLS